MPSAVATTAATTHAAFVGLELYRKERAVRERVESLRKRGYNTLAVPVLNEGRLNIHRGGRRSRYPFEGPAAEALRAALDQPRTSAWLYIDPITAGGTAGQRLGELARKRREWLVRNTEGHISPLGNQEIPRALFSWLNRDYRRFLGDLLFDLAQGFPFGGIILDLRAFPGFSDDPARWYCCSFQSQDHIERQLGVRFDELLAEGTREQILAWRSLLLDEMRHFVVSIASRLTTVRSDLSWKLLIPHVDELVREKAPWIEWFQDGLGDELLVPAGDKESFVAYAAKLDHLTERPRLLMPVYPDEASVCAESDIIVQLPCTGFLIMDPGTNPETILPDNLVRWGMGGALEDNPIVAARAMAYFLGEEFGDDSRLGRFFRRLGVYLEDFDPNPTSLHKTVESVAGIHGRLLAEEIQMPEDKRSLLREVDLLLRLLVTAKPQPYFY